MISLDRALVADPIVSELTTRFPLTLGGEIEAATKLGLEFRITCEYVLEPNEVTGYPELERRYRFTSWPAVDPDKMRAAITALEADPHHPRTT